MKKSLLKILIFISALTLSISAWGNSVSSKNSSDDISGGKIVMYGNHAKFTFAASGKSISHNGSNYTGFSVGKNGNLDCSFSWEANGGVAIKVTNISVDVTGYTAALWETSKLKATFNGTTEDVGDLLGFMTNMSASNNNGLSNNMTMRLTNNTSGSKDFYITNISITYTITPDAPTIKAVGAGIDVSLTSENKFDMTNLIGVSDVTDFMPVSFESNSFNDPLGVNATGAYTFTGKYFYATKAGVYTFTNPYIAAKKDCHEKSSTTTGKVTITVNRLPQSLTMNNGTVCVKSADIPDGTAHSTLNLASLIASQTGNGGVTYQVISANKTYATISGTTFSATQTGEYTIRATKAKTAQYAETTADFKVTVTKWTTQIVFKGSATYPAVFPNIPASDLFEVRDINNKVISGAAITISADNDEVAQVVSNALNPICGGVINVTASYVGTASTYLAAANVSQSITMVKVDDDVNILGRSALVVGDEIDLSSWESSASESAITWSSSNSDVLKVVGGTLIAKNKGEATLTATSAGNCVYNSGSYEMEITVRKPTDPCNHLLMDEPHKLNLGFYLYGGYDKDHPAIKVINDGPQDILTYKTWKYNVVTTQDVHVEILDASDNVLNDTVFTSGQLPAGRDNALQVTVDMKRADLVGAKKLRIYATDVNGILGGTLYKYVSNIKITQQSYLRASTSSLTMSAAKACEPATAEFTVDYSDLAPLRLTCTDEENLTYEVWKGGVKIEDFDNDCGDWGSYTVKLFYVPQAKGAYNETVTVSASGKSVNINFNGTAAAPAREIVWDIPNSNDVMLGLSQTLTAYAKADCINPAGSVTYTVSPAGGAEIDGATVTFNKLGTITITASTVHSDEYEDAVSVTKTFIVSGEYIFKGTIDNDWEKPGNWDIGLVPEGIHDVTIEAPTVVETEVAVNSIKITTGSVTIMPTGGLSVGEGGITGATTENLLLRAGTTDTVKGQTGYLRVDPATALDMPAATVELFSKAYYDYNDKTDNIARWQYVGSPLASTDVKASSVYKLSWIYSWDESSETWFNERATLEFTPFVGYSTTQRFYANGILLEYRGQIVSNKGKHDIDLAWSGKDKGYNALANSFTAPIDITNFEDGDFYHADSTVYLFNTGSRSEAIKAASTKSTEVNNPGQFLSIPIGSARLLKKAYDEMPTTISPMQGFFVHALAGDARVTIDYNKLVWNGNYAKNKAEPLRAPKHTNNAEDEEVGSLQISLFSNTGADHLFMLEAERFDAIFENGYDARKLMGDELNIFSIKDDYKLAVDATNSLIGTQIGVRTGDTTAYVMVFTHLNSERPLALLDKETNQQIDIYEGTEYTFFAVPNSEIAGRFFIVESANAPAVTTGIEETKNGVKAHKFIKNGQLFILKNGVLYTATGTVVR